MTKLPYEPLTEEQKKEEDKWELERENAKWDRMQSARFDHWIRRGQWSVHELAYLLVRKEPSSDNPLFDKYGLPAAFIRHYSDLKDHADDIVATKSLTAISGKYTGSGCMEITYKPTELVEWAKGNGFDIPKELLPLLDVPEQPRLVEEKLDRRERTTLLQIIAVLAAAAELDLTHHSKAAQILQKMGAEQGKELPKKKDTIADKLKEARDLQ